MCIDCAKKLGINTDEILNEQSKTIFNQNAVNMNKQLEGLFKNLSENLGDIDGIEFGAIPVNESPNNFDEDDEIDDESPESPKVFAGAIPLGSIFGNFFGGQNQAQESNGSVKKKVK